VLAALSGMERGYIRDRTLEGHESARARGKVIGGAAVTDEAMLAVALHLRGQELSLRDIAARPASAEHLSCTVADSLQRVPGAGAPCEVIDTDRR